MDNTKRLQIARKIGIIYVLPVFLSILLFLVINSTSPLSSGPIGILTVFSVIYALSVALVIAIIHFAGVILRFFKIKKYLPTKKTYYAGSVIALWPVLILALNTLGRLDIGEIILVTVLTLVGCFYAARRNMPTAVI